MAQALKHRGELAGMQNLHAHHMRHTFVQRYLADGGHRRDLMRLAGWKSRQLLGRYGATELHGTARDARQPFSLGDRL